MVVRDRKYIRKVEELLNQPTIKTITADPTIRQKSKLINILKTSRQKVASMKQHIEECIPGVGSPKFYEFPKLHKAGIPLRTIVSSIGAVSYRQLRN